MKGSRSIFLRRNVQADRSKAVSFVQQRYLLLYFLFVSCCQFLKIPLQQLSESFLRGKKYGAARSNNMGSQLRNVKGVVRISANNDVVDNINKITTTVTLTAVKIYMIRFTSFKKNVHFFC